MKTRFLPLRRHDHYRQLLRYCGYGAPNTDDLFWSTQSALTLIAQDSLQPFFKDDGEIKTVISTCIPCLGRLKCYRRSLKRPGWK